jgi:hypothetical protein
MQIPKGWSRSDPFGTLPREGHFGMFRLLRRKRGLLHQTKTSNLCDLLERILSKGMFIFGRQIFPADRPAGSRPKVGTGWCRLPVPLYGSASQNPAYERNPGKREIPKNGTGQAGAGDTPGHEASVQKKHKDKPGRQSCGK